MASPRAAIVGAGIAGLAAALLLRRSGWEARVLERAPHPSPIGSGILLQPPGLAVLHRMGLGDRILARGARVARLDGRTRSGRRVLGLDYAHWKPGCFGLGLHRGALWHVLHEAAVAEGVSVEGGVEVHGAADLPACDVAIVATGSRTTLRVPLGFDDRTRPYEWGALWANVPVPAGWPSEVTLQRFHGTRRMMGLMPVGYDGQGKGPFLTMFWSERLDRIEAVKARGWTAWREEVQRHWPEAHAATECLSGFGELTVGVYADVRVTPWSRGHVALAGDAAHGTSPQLGAGTTLALLDAEALRDALAAEPDVPKALERYSRARREHVAYYQWASRLMNPFFQSDGRAMGLLRDGLMGYAGSFPGLRREFLATLTGHKAGILWGRLEA